MLSNGEPFLVGNREVEVRGLGFVLRFVFDLVSNGGEGRLCIRNNAEGCESEVFCGCGIEDVVGKWEMMPMTYYKGRFGNMVAGS